MKLLCTVLLFLSLGNSYAQSLDTVSIYFDFDRFELSTQARETLDNFIHEAHQIQGNIQLKGHCDSKGTDAYNDLLSQKRVNAVRDYLVERNINLSSLTQLAMGEREPLNGNNTSEERQLNRRVDLIFSKPVVEEIPINQESEEPQNLEQKIDTVKEGSTLRLQNINFYGGRHTFLPQSMPALQELLQVMKNNPTLEIEIQGHICCIPGGEDGMDYDTKDRRLSLNRARAVYRFLLDNGISASRMNYKGFAGTKLLVYPETTEADRTTNRRVEIMIVKK